MTKRSANARLASSSLIGLVLVACGVMPLQAHETRMAFLDLKQDSDRAYSFALKIPVAGRSSWPISVVVPDECQPETAERRQIPGNVLIEQRFQCDWEESQPHVLVRGLDGGYIDVLVRLEDIGGNESTRVVSGSLSRVPLTTHGSGALDRIALGFEHILGGFDHLLFVTGLLLLVGGIRTLIGAVTAFTVAHSITLGVTTLGLMSVPPKPVEAFIAFSIVYLAYRVVLERRIEVGSDAYVSSPAVMAFAFGLLHGFGFAGALAESGLADSALVTTLFLFNVGIELGQVLFILVVSFFVWAFGAAFNSLRVVERLELGMAYSIGGLGSFWFIERLTAF